MADPSTHDTVAEDGELIGSTQLGRYRVTRKIGQGGMGAVYEAVHVKLDKRVAIKVLLEKYARSEGVIQRLEQEARLASAIGDPHIVDVADIGQTHDGRTFIVMELLAGESLAQLIGRTKDMSETRIAALVSQAARALAAAHGKGVIHRDIKPENLFVSTRDGAEFVKVVDFGISKLVRGDREDPRLTGTGMVIGTAAYMSPEQARGDDVDERTDVYALGVVMYEAATGRLPFVADNYLKMLSQVANAEPPSPSSLRPSLSERFERIAMRAMAKHRDDRYASARELADALEALVAGTATAPTASMPRTALPTAPARPALSTMPTTSVPIKRRTWLGIAGVAAVAAAIGLALVLRGGSDTVEIFIETNPPGAAILQGDKVLGYSPMTYRFLRENKVVALTAQMAGYEIACFTVNPAEDRHDVHIRMPEPKPGVPPCTSH
jgi:serine/threonine-protein kinase